MDPSQEGNSKSLRTSASSGNATGAGASTVPPDYRQQYDCRNGLFIHLYQTQREGHAHATIRTVNQFCGNAGQTATCAVNAIYVYNMINGTSFKLETGGDSNAFNPLQRPADGTFFVHLNFDASDPVKGTHTFFAELKGKDEPSVVTMVVSLGSKSDDGVEVSANSADHNCIYCTGLRHSVTLKFQGFIEDAD